MIPTQISLFSLEKSHRLLSGNMTTLVITQEGNSMLYCAKEQKNIQQHKIY